MASTKPGPIGKNILNFGLSPGPLSWITIDTPGAVGRGDFGAPDFSFVRQPLAFELASLAGSLTLGIPTLRLGAPRAATTPIPGGMIPESRLTACATQVETDFKHKVYLAHVARARTKRSFFAGVPASDLALVEGSEYMQKDAAVAAKKLLADVHAELAAKQAAKDAQALQVTKIWVISGYRDPNVDFGIWDRNYQKYFNSTATMRKAAAGGEFGVKAVELLVGYIAGKKAAPGFSNHTRGKAFDIGTEEGGQQYGANSAPRDQAAYAKTWLYGWMTANAVNYDFKQLATEVWHWDYQL